MRKLKTIFKLVVFLFLLGTYSTILAQEQSNVIQYHGESTKFAFMVTNTKHFKSVIATAENMEIKKNDFSFEIVVVGKLAEDLVKDKELIKQIDKSVALGVKIVVCEGALARFNIPKSDLDKRLLTTPNGWIYMFELKDRGFNTLSI
ncbi:hypothetical protein [Myroides odoratimimus]|uniref:DsrE family protein n=1 Tax=Myroides odoratimimus TaxID=76832 RepID=UPI003100E40E